MVAKYSTLFFAYPYMAYNIIIETRCLSNNEHLPLPLFFFVHSLIHKNYVQVGTNLNLLGRQVKNRMIVTSI
jgi:hypothetical protein